MMNVSKVKTLGLDLNLITESNISEIVKLNISASYSYMKAIDITNKNSVLWNSQIPYTPLNSGNGIIELKNNFINIGYSLLATSKRYYSSVNIPQNEINGYVDHSLWLEKSYNIKRSMISLRFDALNLSDKNYEVIKFFPMPGRNYRITAKYIF